ncbi:hypothetical protein B0I35DRAFT_37198 [Stachybotrys elegans]|uniref:Uncharacterized protein n=1 Tax=Stachybotrys elegans TaxID=80388 RepID=A0A8K0WWX9_9HYPO|nr:hypothetical protein B0I35DRAFT_37198 [Stachybotrys elegans]
MCNRQTQPAHIEQNQERQWRKGRFGALHDVSPCFFLKWRARKPPCPPDGTIDASWNCSFPLLARIGARPTGASYNSPSSLTFSFV